MPVCTCYIRGQNLKMQENCLWTLETTLVMWNLIRSDSLITGVFNLSVKSSIGLLTYTNPVLDMTLAWNHVLDSELNVMGLHRGSRCPYLFEKKKYSQNAATNFFK